MAVSVPCTWRWWGSYHSGTTPLLREDRNKKKKVTCQEKGKVKETINQHGFCSTTIEEKYKKIIHTRKSKHSKKKNSSSNLDRWEEATGLRFYQTNIKVEKKCDGSCFFLFHVPGPMCAGHWGGSIGQHVHCLQVNVKKNLSHSTNVFLTWQHSMTVSIWHVVLKAAKKKKGAD